MMNLRWWSFLGTATAALASETTVNEYEKYQCAENIFSQSDYKQNMNACFCGLLNDAQEPEQAASASLLSSATCSGGVANGYPCSNVDLRSHMPLSTFGSFEANDIWGWSNGGREFAILGLADGTAVIEVTNPDAPVFRGKLNTASVSSSWRDVKVYNDHAFIVSEAASHGMQVLDLRNFMLVPPPGGTNVQATARYTGVGSAHNIVINEATGFAYIVGSRTCSGGLHMVNIQNPSNPQFAGCYAGDGYVHDAQCVIYNGPDVAHRNKEICFCSNEDTVTIVDVTNKGNPIQLSRTGYPQAGYTHQGWLDEKQEYYVFGDETDEMNFANIVNTKTLVMNVQNLDAPFLAGSYFASGNNRAIDHNLYIRDNIIYLASYRAGLRLLQINDLSTADLTEIGFFDIYPANDGTAFNGAWSVYPFFSSGNVIVSGVEQGLFVLTPNLSSVDLLPCDCSQFSGSATSCRDACNGISWQYCAYHWNSNTCVSIDSSQCDCSQHNNDWRSCRDACDGLFPWQYCTIYQGQCKNVANGCRCGAYSQDWVGCRSACGGSDWQYCRFNPNNRVCNTKPV